MKVAPGAYLPEDRFTAPTKLCPNPRLWRSSDSESTEREVGELIYGLVRGLQPRAVLETGTGFGEVAERIAFALGANQLGTLYTIEQDRERYAYVCSRLYDEIEDRIVDAVCADTLAWEPPAGTIFDFCWFDAYYRNRVAEFDRYRPWMRAGTIVGFHDTAPGHGGNPSIPGSDIRSQIAEGLRGKIRLIHLPTPRGLTLGEVVP